VVTLSRTDCSTLVRPHLCHDVDVPSGLLFLTYFTSIWLAAGTMEGAHRTQSLPHPPPAHPKSRRSSAITRMYQIASRAWFAASSTIWPATCRRITSSHTRLAPNPGQL
jgi:hypothetical protein